MSQFQSFWAFFCCQYQRHLSLVFSTYTVIDLEKNEKQHSIPHTLNCNSWKFREFSSKNDSVRYSNVFSVAERGKNLFFRTILKLNTFKQPNQTRTESLSLGNGDCLSGTSWRAATMLLQCIVIKRRRT